MKRRARAIITAKCCIFIGAIKLIAHGEQPKQKADKKHKRKHTTESTKHKTDMRKQTTARCGRGELLLMDCVSGRGRARGRGRRVGVGAVAEPGRASV